MSEVLIFIAMSVGAALAGSALGSWIFRAKPPAPKLEPRERVRRNRAFNAHEIANLESWGVKVRDDEKQSTEKLSTAQRVLDESLEAMERSRERAAQAQRQARRQWWDSKRGIWRDEETGRKV